LRFLHTVLGLTNFMNVLGILELGINYLLSNICIDYLHK
jgi:hypothetical protein